MQTACQRPLSSIPTALDAHRERLSAQVLPVLPFLQARHTRAVRGRRVAERRAPWHGRCFSSASWAPTAHQRRTQMNRIRNEQGKVGYALLWLLGVPLPVLLVLYLIFR